MSRAEAIEGKRGADCEDKVEPDEEECISAYREERKEWEGKGNLF